MTNFFQSMAIAAMAMAFSSLGAQAEEPVFTATSHPLVEEGTGTGCGWCVRGWIGMRELQKRQPNAVVAVWHMSDPMSIVATVPFKYGNGIPGAAINRTVNAIDPFYGSSTDEKEMGIEDDVIKAMSTPPVADLDLTACWNETNDTILVNTDLHFAQTGAKCKVGYLLCGSGYQHPELESWTQSNYYSGWGEYGMLTELCNMDAHVKDFVYDDVVIYAKELRGVVGSLPDTVQPDARLTHHYAIPKADVVNEDGEKLIEDRDNMKLDVIVYLLNRINRVTNARKVTVTASTPTGITGVTSDENAAVVATTYFDLNGRQVAQPDHGFFIKVENLSNGSTRTAKIVK